MYTKKNQIFIFYVLLITVSIYLIYILYSAYKANDMLVFQAFACILSIHNSTSALGRLFKQKMEKDKNDV
jgi:hypothetical protein